MESQRSRARGHGLRLPAHVNQDELEPVHLPSLPFDPSACSPIARAWPNFLQLLYSYHPLDRAKWLADQFCDLEDAEKRRLGAARQSSTLGLRRDVPASRSAERNIPVGPPGQDPCPFSLRAGLTSSDKNRYNNILPWEHSRIKLPDPSSQRGSDYINASKIAFRSDGNLKQSLTSEEQEELEKKVYIAAQGPLESTLEDFWLMVREEDVGVIVMLTRTEESGKKKCTDYLKSGKYGGISITIESSQENKDEKEATAQESQESAGESCIGFGRPHSSNGRAFHKDSGHLTPVVKTTIRLTSSDRPGEPPRLIRHLHYRKWPDFDVPPAAEEIIALVDQTRIESRSIVQTNRHAVQSHLACAANRGHAAEETVERLAKSVGLGQGPLLVHCSAGVGRTGTFVIIDVMTEVIKLKQRQALALRGMSSHSSDQQAGEVSKSSNQVKVKARVNPLPRFLQTDHCDHQTEDIAPMWSESPVMLLTDEMREQRMSMIANYRQYVFVHEVLLKYFLQTANLYTGSSIMQPSRPSRSQPDPSNHQN